MYFLLSWLQCQSASRPWLDSVIYLTQTPCNSSRLIASFGMLYTLVKVSPDNQMLFLNPIQNGAVTPGTKRTHCHA